MSDTLTLSRAATRTGLTLPEGISFNEWRAIGDRLARMGDSANWWIGDWLCYGDRYRRDYAQAMQLVDRELGSLRNLAYVAANVPAEVREPNLSWSHHRVVTSLAPREQRRWLDEALRQGWSVRELEQALMQERPPRPAALMVRATGDLLELCTLAAQQEGLEPAVWALSVLERAARDALAVGA